MKFSTYDLGYGVAVAWEWRGRRHALRLHLPFPVTKASWRYLLRKGPK